jgi:hypothetical protein
MASAIHHIKAADQKRMATNVNTKLKARTRMETKRESGKTAGKSGKT